MNFDRFELGAEERGRVPLILFLSFFLFVLGVLLGVLLSTMETVAADTTETTDAAPDEAPEMAPDDVAAEMASVMETDSTAITEAAANKGNSPLEDKARKAKTKKAKARKAKAKMNPGERAYQAFLKRMKEREKQRKRKERQEVRDREILEALMPAGFQEEDFKDLELPMEIELQNGIYCLQGGFGLDACAEMWEPPLGMGFTSESEDDDSVQSMDDLLEDLMDIIPGEEIPHFRLWFNWMYNSKYGRPYTVPKLWTVVGCWMLYHGSREYIQFKQSIRWKEWRVFHKWLNKYYNRYPFVGYSWPPMMRILEDYKRCKRRAGFI